MRSWLWPVPLAAGILQVPLAREAVDGFKLDAINRFESNESNEASLWAWAPWVPHYGLASLQAPQPEGVTLWDYQDILYTAELRVGPSAKPLRVMVDTGSSNLWLKKEVVKTAEVYGGQEIHVTYGLGEVYARAASDRMCLAGVCVSKQAFLLAVEIKGMGRNSDLFDGLLGMAFPQMLDVGSQTFFQSLGAAGGFDQPGFGLVLRGFEQHSFLTLGEVHDLIHDAEVKTSTKGVTLDVHGFQTIAQREQGEPGPLMFWFVPMDLRVYTGTSGPLLELTGFGMVDSGTSLLLLPMPAYKQAMWALTFGLPKLHFHRGLVSCDGTKLNPLVFHFPGRDEELFVSLSTADLLLPAGVSFGRKLCKIGISPLPDDGKTLPHMVLGDVFLRKVYSIFDLEGATVTFVSEASTSSTRGSRGSGLPLEQLNVWPLTQPDGLTLIVVTFLSVTVVICLAAHVVRRVTENELNAYVQLSA